MKRLLILLLSAALVLAGCADSESGVPVTGSIGPGGGTAADEAPSTAEATAEPAVSPTQEPEA